MNVDGIRDSIARHHSRYNHLTKIFEPRGLLFFELHTTTGYSLGNPSKIDAFHMGDKPCDMVKTAYEIKVSRQDFRREIERPAKRKPAMRVSNYFYFVTPPGLVDPDLVPDDCGLVEVDPRWRVVVKAPFRDSYPPTWPFLAAVARAIRRSK